MARNGIWNLLTLLVVCTIGVEGWAEIGKPRKVKTPGAADHDSGVVTHGSSSELTCKIYALAEMGDDPKLCEWLVKTIPEVIQPGSWSTDGKEGKPVLNYFAPRKVLVVYHTPDVHAKVEGFLKEMGQATAKDVRTAEKFASTDRVMPARHLLPAALGGGMGSALARPAATGTVGKVATPATPAEAARLHPSVDARSGSIPPADKHPRHLFHIILEGLEGPDDIKLKNFTLRYEGEGIIDSNIVELLKSLHKQGATLGDVWQMQQTVPNATLPPSPFLEGQPKPEPSTTSTPIETKPAPNTSPMPATSAVPLSSNPARAFPPPPPPPGFAPSIPHGAPTAGPSSLSSGARSPTGPVGSVTANPGQSR